MFRRAGAHAPRKRRQPFANAILILAVSVTTAVILGSAMGRWRIVPVLSGSMEPALRTGDLAIVVPQQVTEIRPGEVIVYRIPIGDHHVEIHRVVRIVHGAEGTDVVTAGDANAAPDPWTARLDGSTVWRLSARVPLLGYVVLFIGRPEVRIGCLALGIAMLLALGLRSIWGAPHRPAAARPIGVGDGDA